MGHTETHIESRKEEGANDDQGFSSGAEPREQRDTRRAGEQRNTTRLNVLAKMLYKKNILKQKFPTKKSVKTNR